MANPTKQGTVPFQAAGLDTTCETWYCTFGDVNSPGKTPLVILHGGPGAAHEYLLTMVDLYEMYEIPLVFYDQVGCGNSTRLKEKAGNNSFWTCTLFINEFHSLMRRLNITKYDVYGHSWGAMLGAELAALRPKGLRRLILASGPASMETWLKGMDQLQAELPSDVKMVIDQGDKDRNYESKEYEAALETFYKRHLCRLEPWPAKEVEDALKHMMGDPTTYTTMWGISELVVTGNLKTWSVVNKLDQIEAPTLLLNGRYDEATDVSIEPFFNLIKRVQWATLENSSHFAHVEERERYMRLIANFIRPVMLD